MQYTSSQKCLERPVILRIKNVILLIKNFGTSEAQETSPLFFPVQIVNKLKV